MVDHVSDTFVATNVPLHALIDAARRGNAPLVEETAQIFMEHASKLIEVRVFSLFFDRKIEFSLRLGRACRLFNVWSSRRNQISSFSRNADSASFTSSHLQSIDFDLLFIDRFDRLGRQCSANFSGAFNIESRAGKSRCISWSVGKTRSIIDRSGGWNHYHRRFSRRFGKSYSRRY